MPWPGQRGAQKRAPGIEKLSARDSGRRGGKSQPSWQPGRTDFVMFFLFALLLVTVTSFISLHIILAGVEKASAPTPRRLKSFASQLLARATGMSISSTTAAGGLTSGVATGLPQAYSIASGKEMEVRTPSHTGSSPNHVGLPPAVPRRAALPQRGQEEARDTGKSHAGLPKAIVKRASPQSPGSEAARTSQSPRVGLPKAVPKSPQSPVVQQDRGRQQPQAAAQTGQKHAGLPQAVPKSGIPGRPVQVVRSVQEAPGLPQAVPQSQENRGLRGRPPTNAQEQRPRAPPPPHHAGAQASAVPALPPPPPQCGEAEARQAARKVRAKLEGHPQAQALDLAIGRAEQSFRRLLNGKIQVHYMRSRICSRLEAWLMSLVRLGPSMLPSKQGVHDGPFALVWPQAAYLHFGVKRVWSLGEYTQWADLCAALCTLGVKVDLWPYGRHHIPMPDIYRKTDLIFTDYDGVHGGKSMDALPPSDKTWLLDTFGTDGTVLDHQFWGRIRPLTDYPLRRFLTLIPGFSPRNTFLGAATVASRTEDSDAAKELPRRNWQCVLWSKVHPWLNASLGWPTYHLSLLREYSKYCKVIATIDKQDTFGTEKILQSCCPEIDIRNVQSPASFRDLLQSSAVYLGVGEPLIAPSCFEALSVGTHVIQPWLPEPHAVQNKPITQKWTSQHPFLEQVPEPFAYTVDPLDFKALAETFRKIRAAYDSVYSQADTSNTTLRKFYTVGEYPGREVYSTEGFLERVARVVNNTRSLTPADWEWEREDHPQLLPDRAFPKRAAG
eukprot:s87_g21.t1